MLDLDEDDIEEEQHERKKLKQSHLYKAPTAEELSQLRETENLFHSNLFRMQITELLAEVSLKDDERHKYQSVINEVIQALKSLKEGKERKIKDLSLFEKNSIQIPLANMCKKLDGTYTFLPPSKVSLIGSFDLKTLVKPLVCIDIGVQMPDEFFVDRDFINYRYFVKRSLYMAHAALQLKKSLQKKIEQNFELSFKSDYCSTFKPFLILKTSKFF